ncbi:MAG: hypothetical protein QM820_06975 [Minicystis sp.]
MKRFLFLAMAVLAGCGENLTHPVAGSPAGEGGAGGAGQLSCLPNLDGKVEAAEFKAVLDTPVDYLVGNNRPVSLAGEVDPEGRRVWDFSKEYPDDGQITIAATGLDDKWFQASFPEGQWVAPADALGTTYGVYAADAQAVYLLGLASKEENPADNKKTLLVYDEKVAVYRFPLTPGSSWISVGKVSGATANGLPYSGSHKYEVKDDGAGMLRMPNLTFEQAHRVRTTLTITSNAGPEEIVRRQTGFVFECFGEVVRATAPDGEMNDDFGTAAELRRLKN